MSRFHSLTLKMIIIPELLLKRHENISLLLLDICNNNDNHIFYISIMYITTIF